MTFIKTADGTNIYYKDWGNKDAPVHYVLPWVAAPAPCFEHSVLMASIAEAAIHISLVSCYCQRVWRRKQLIC